MQQFGVAPAERDPMTEGIISAAIEVHRFLGPGMLESTYRECMCRELDLRGMKYTKEVVLPLDYKGLKIGSGYRMDLVVEGLVVVELKALEKILAVHEAQLLSYLKLSGIKKGLLINFNVALQGTLSRRDS